MPAADLLVGLLAVAGGATLGRLGDMPALRWPKPLHVVTAACSAVGAVTTVTHATGWGSADAAWRIFFVVTVMFAASRANPASLLVASAVAAAIAEPGTAWLGLASIGVVVATSVPAVRAIAGGLLGTGLLHAGWPGGRGATAAVTGAVLLLVVLSTDRRFIARAALIGGGVLTLSVLATATAGLSLAGQRNAAIQAVDAGQLGLDAARGGQSAEAQAQFQRAAELLHGVDVALRRPVAGPAFAVPVVGANLAELRELVEVAQGIAMAGVTTAGAADIDHITPKDGAVDLAALRSFERPLQDLDVALTAARHRLRARGSMWTVGPLQQRIADLDERVMRAQKDARQARRSVNTVPRLLGGDGPRRYLLAVMTPSELRDGGGFVGNWGILEARDGRLTLPRFGRIAELYSPGEPYAISVSPQYDDRYVRGLSLGTWPQNLLGSPDLPSNAVAAAQLLEQAGEGKIDGVVALDPYAMASLLELLGPIEVDGWDGPLDASNVAQTLLFDQYRTAGGPQRLELLARTTQELFRKLTTGALPAVARMAEALGPSVRGGHLQMASLHTEDQPLLAQLQLDRRLPTPAVDALGLFGQNAAPSKLDWFLHRTISYRLSVSPSGRAHGQVTVRVHNAAPDHGLPADYFQYEGGGLAPGVDVQAFSLFTPLVANRVTIDGSPVEFGISAEQRFNVFDRFVTIAPGATVTLRFDISGQLPVRGGPYQLDLLQQPTANPDDVEIVVNGRTLFAGPLDHPRTLRVSLSAASRRR